jgi:hypothetical protein
MGGRWRLRASGGALRLQRADRSTSTHVPSSMLPTCTDHEPSPCRTCVAYCLEVAAHSRFMSDKILVRTACVAGVDTARNTLRVVWRR